MSRDARGSEHTLVEQAPKTKQHAATPYSGFALDSVLLTANRIVFTGCNLESSSYGLTVCAERIALFKALSEGHRKFRAMAVVIELEEFCPPC